MSTAPHDFDEAFLSGYLDGELTQGDAQRVRLHLETCAKCSTTANELLRLREATMNTEFQVPDTQWDETPRGGVSRFFHNFGWLIAGLWVAGLSAYLVWQIATDSESVRIESVLGVGIFLAFALIVLSALIDRMRTRQDDPYRKVQK